MALSKASRSSLFDVAKCIRTDTISYGLESALSSGNWVIKRFRMDRKGVTQVWVCVGFVCCWLSCLFADVRVAIVGFNGDRRQWLE
jgi:hypothetical protein